MTTEEKREYIVKKALTRKGKNQYSQDIDKRTLIEMGYGDCSGTMWYWYYKLFGMNIGVNTNAQIQSDMGEDVCLSICDGIPDEEKLKKGDLLFFRGSDEKRYKGVGHVEMYIGDGKIFGHGSGTGGTVKDLREYCRKRYNQKSTQYLKNKGLICVRRFIKDEEGKITELESVNDIVWELCHRGVIEEKELWLSKLEEDKNAYWLARKALKKIMETENQKGI